MQANWYEDFFDQTMLDLWQAAVPAEHTQPECDFLEKTLAVPKGARILDVPCGHGRHSIELARRGYAVTGVDLSPAFLAEAQRRSGQQGLPVEWHRENMHRIRYQGVFDGAFCWGNSFGYLDREATLEFIRAVADSLKPEAQFILETGIAAESVLPHFKEDTWDPVGDYLYLERHRYDIVSGQLAVQTTLVHDGKLTHREYAQTVYSCAELVRMLAAVGLETQALYGSVDGTPYQLGCRELILVARRT